MVARELDFGLVTRRWALLAPLAFLAALIAGSGAAAAGCSAPYPTRVVVEQVFPKPTHDYNRTPNELRQMQPDNPQAVHGTLLWMTSYRTLAEPLPEIRTIAQPGGFYCVYLTALTI